MQEHGTIKEKQKSVRRPRIDFFYVSAPNFH